MFCLEVYNLYSSKICERLKKVRVENGYTQAQIAEILDISNEAYKKIERGESRISVEKLILLEEKLNISADYLMFGRKCDIDSAWEGVMELSDVDRFKALLRLCAYFSAIKEKRFFHKDDIDKLDENIIEIIDALGIND